jgi:hypothetical protein
MYNRQARLISIPKQIGCFLTKNLDLPHHMPYWKMNEPQKFSQVKAKVLAETSEPSKSSS